MTRPKLYLAGPGVFLPDASSFARELKATCLRYGCEGFHPFDLEVDAPREPRPQIAERIYRTNLALMEEADGIVAEITPFRGPHMDPGTAFEIGYFAAREKPIFLWTKDPLTLLQRMRAMEMVSWGGRDDQGMQIEDYGLVENLMITSPAQAIRGSAEEAIIAASCHFETVRRETILQNARAL